MAFCMLVAFNACKKADDNKNGSPAPSTTCKLKSTKEIIASNGNPNQYGGFVLYYDNADRINKVSFLDSTTGNEDSSSYALLLYTNSNITSLKLFQQGQEAVNSSITYSTLNKVEQRVFNLDGDFGQAKITQIYFYDNNGYIEYCLSRFEADNIPGLGKVVSIDSARYLNYNSFGRPSGVVVFNSFTSTNQGAEPFSFSEEIAYQYDAKGNRTKTSSKNVVSAPFIETYSATFDIGKTLGDAKEANVLLSKLFFDGWEDPNLNSKDTDVSLKLTETNTENGVGETKTSIFIFNDKGNPASSKETSTTEIKNTTYTYVCK